MNTPSPHPTPDEALTELIQAMHEMRDALLRVSLLLQDHQFDHDRSGRTQAVAATDALIAKTRAP